MIFVPGAAPGDRVRVRVREEHGNWARADLVHVCVPGAARRTAPCPWVARCGGCPWQHVDYAAQLAAKETNVREALARIAGVRTAEMLPIVAAPNVPGNRGRLDAVGSGTASITATDPRNEALRHHRCERHRELCADLVLGLGWEDVDDPVNGLRRVIGVKCCEHQVPGFCKCQRQCDGFEVAHFAHEDDVGVFSKCGT